MRSMTDRPSGAQLTARLDAPFDLIEFGLGGPPTLGMEPRPVRYERLSRTTCRRSTSGARGLEVPVRDPPPAPSKSIGLRPERLPLRRGRAGHRGVLPTSSELGPTTGHGRAVQHPGVPAHAAMGRGEAQLIEQPAAARRPNAEGALGLDRAARGPQTRTAAAVSGDDHLPRAPERSEARRRRGGDQVRRPVGLDRVRQLLRDQIARAGRSAAGPPRGASRCRGPAGADSPRCAPSRPPAPRPSARSTSKTKGRPLRRCRWSRRP